MIASAQNGRNGEYLGSVTAQPVMANTEGLRIWIRQYQIRYFSNLVRQTARPSAVRLSRVDFGRWLQMIKAPVAVYVPAPQQIVVW